MVLTLHTVKPLSEHEASHDVVIQIGRPIVQLSQRLAPPADILDDEGLGGAECVVGEGVVFLSESAFVTFLRCAN